MRTHIYKRERERNATRINYREHINSYRMDDVCVQHEFQFLCIVERILTRIPVNRRMNTTRTERGPDFVPVVVHVPDHGRLMCVLSSTYARKNEANLKLFFSLVFLFRVLNPSYNKAFSLSIFLHFRAHKSALNAHLTRDLIRVLYIKRENTRGTLYLVRKSERERVKTASFKVVLYSHI